MYTPGPFALLSVCFEPEASSAVTDLLSLSHTGLGALCLDEVFRNPIFCKDTFSSGYSHIQLRLFWLYNRKKVGKNETFDFHRFV